MDWRPRIFSCWTTVSLNGWLLVRTLKDLDILLLFDISRSMAPVLTRVGDSARKLLAGLRAGDRVAAMAFDTDAWLVFP